MTFLELFTILYSKKNRQSCVNFGIDSERIIIIEVPQCDFTLHSAARGSALFRGLAPRTDTVSLALTISLYLLWFRYYISISWLGLRIEVQVVIEMAQKTNRQAGSNWLVNIPNRNPCLSLTECTFELDSDRVMLDNKTRAFLQQTSKHQFDCYLTSSSVVTVFPNHHRPVSTIVCCMSIV